MPDQDTKPTPFEQSGEAGQGLKKILRTLLWVVPVIIFIVIVGIVVLAVLGPAIGNVYTYGGSAL